MTVWGSPEQILMHFKWILIENQKKSVWGNLKQNLMDFLESLIENDENLYAETQSKF